jgi:hypothetical protein
VCLYDNIVVDIHQSRVRNNCGARLRVADVGNKFHRFRHPRQAGQLIQRLAIRPPSPGKQQTTILGARIRHHIEGLLRCHFVRRNPPLAKSPIGQVSVAPPRRTLSLPGPLVAPAPSCLAFWPFLFPITFLFPSFLLSFPSHHPKHHASQLNSHFPSSFPLHDLDFRSFLFSAKMTGRK